MKVVQMQRLENATELGDAKSERADGGGGG